MYVENTYDLAKALGVDRDLLESQHGLDEGIYEVSDIAEVLLHSAGEIDLEQVKAFIAKYPDFAIGSAYQTFTLFLISEKPKKAALKSSGSGFNYGSCNLLEDCPKRLLIIAQNN